MRSLKVTKTVLAVYRFFLSNLPLYLRIIWVYLLASVGAVLLLERFSPVGGVELQLFTTMAVLIAASGSAAVAWHRYLLLDETPAPGPVYWRFGAREAAYLVRQAVIGVVVALGGMIVFFVLSFLTVQAGLERSGLLSLLTVAAPVLLSLMLLGRVGMMLPGFAVGREVYFSDSWDVTRGNGPQLTAGLLLTALPLLLPLIALFWFKEAIPFTPIVRLSAHALLFLDVGLVVSFLSFSFWALDDSPRVDVADRACRTSCGGGPGREPGR